MEPIQFLRGHPPFDRLAAGMLRELESGLEIAYYPADTRVLLRGGPPNRHLFVIRKGTVRLEREGDLVQVLEEGDCFGHPSLIGRTSPHVDVVAAEDTLIYQVPGNVFDRLMTVPEFAQFFLVDLSERLRRTSSSRPLPLGRELGTPVGRLPVATPVSVGCETTVGEAARLMRDKRISSVLVDCDPPGILTDRDLRSRVLAEGLGPATEVGEVATRPMLTIGADATLFETLVFMLEHHVHHAPLVRGGHIMGIVTDTDLLRFYMKTPIYLLRNIERAALPEDMAHYDTELAAMVETMMWGGLTAAQVGPVVSRLNDALVARFLRITEREIGPPPVPYAWIVFGSEGRMEQTLLTDQDNAIVYANAEGGHDAYFEALADRTVRALVAAAFPPCPGGFMATNWRRPLASWVALFRDWIEKPEPRALVEALNFFDFRVVHGGLDLSALEGLLLKAGREQIFMAHFARASVGLQPPLGAFRHIRETGDGVDLKTGGLAPIVSLARLHALEAGCASRSTLARLDGAARSGTLSRAGADTLAEGFRFLLGLRLREQLRALRAGRAVNNHVRLEHLEPVERQHLKDIFVAVREIQRAAELRYAVQRLA
jgi:CBS domain-containing protein